MRKRKRKLKAREVAVLLRVQDQMLRMQRVAAPEPELTVEEYRKMDRTVMQMQFVKPKPMVYCVYPDMDLGDVNLLFWGGYYGQSNGRSL